MNAPKAYIKKSLTVWVFIAAALHSNPIQLLFSIPKFICEESTHLWMMCTGAAERRRFIYWFCRLHHVDYSHKRHLRSNGRQKCFHFWVSSIPCNWKYCASDCGSMSVSLPICRYCHRRYRDIKLFLLHTISSMFVISRLVHTLATNSVSLTVDIDFTVHRMHNHIQVLMNSSFTIAVWHIAVQRGDMQTINL